MTGRLAEFDLVARIRDRAGSREDVQLGIGDDAAILRVPAGNDLVVSTDTLNAGVHFPHDTASRDIGWKALAVNLSDLAAMGAEPAWCTLNLTLPDANSEWLDAFLDGFLELAKQHDVALVGGDTTRGPLSITVTAHGFVPHGAALRRSGAQVGDVVCVTGTLGDAALCLHYLRRDGAIDIPAYQKMKAASGLDKREKLAYLETRLNRPTPRVMQGLLLRGRATACIDISDGLLADLAHVCKASNVGADITYGGLPASSAFMMFHFEEFQLTGGDDYELCFTVSEADVDNLFKELADTGCAASRIGRIVVGSSIEARDPWGEEFEFARVGWQHFE